MKTKRLKKLLMGMGLSRNQVNHMVKDQRENGAKGVSNKLYYFHAKSCVQRLGPEMLPFIKSFVLGDADDDIEHTCGECEDFYACGDWNVHYPEDAPACKDFRPEKKARPCCEHGRAKG